MFKINVEKEKKQVILSSPSKLSFQLESDFNIKEVETEGRSYSYILWDLPFNNFIILSLYSRYKNSFDISKEDLGYIIGSVKGMQLPEIYVNNPGWINISVPSIPSYEKFTKNISAKHQVLFSYTVPFSRFYEVLRVVLNWDHPFLPAPVMRESFTKYAFAELSDSSLKGLSTTDIRKLITFAYGYRIKDGGYKKLNLYHCSDLLLNRPKDYEDRTNVVDLRYAPFGKTTIFKGTYIANNSGFGNQVKLICDVNGKQVNVTMWGGAWAIEQFKEGDTIYIIGSKIRGSNISAQEILSELDIQSLPIKPRYPQSPTNGFKSHVLMMAVEEIFTRFDGSEIAQYFTSDDGYTFWNAVNDLHFPKNVDIYKKSINYLSLLELLYLQIILIDNKNKKGIRYSPKKRYVPNGYYDNGLRALPFVLTEDQQVALDKIVTNLNSDEASRMLLSADTGSGKSVVAQLSSLYTVDSGQQVAILAPTEVLARQLYDTFVNIIKRMDKKPNITYLSSGTSTKDKNEIKRLVKDGTYDIVVGTHSIINLEYNNLGLLVIDEQQKFGAKQRDTLIASRPDGKIPDVLSQTATPIPRSTALIMYGDIELIQMENKPQGRLPVITKWVQESPKQLMSQAINNVWSTVSEEITNNRQVFIITPAVEDNNSSDTTSVKKTTKLLQNKFPQYKIDSLYGSMKREDQTKVINDFRDGKFNILVASSIVEVGIDIPEATVMIILDANRFGASSLHQIRGRVGRNSYQSYCYLISDADTKDATRRLMSLVESNNGFDIALVDLETRQEGDILGERQSGVTNLRFAELSNHMQLIGIARAKAEEFYNSDLKEQVLEDAKAFLNVEN